MENSEYLINEDELVAESIDLCPVCGECYEVSELEAHGGMCGYCWASEEGPYGNGFF